jgi:hypothetical protein
MLLPVCCLFAVATKQRLLLSMQVQRGLKSLKDMNKTHRDKETEPPATPKNNVKKRLGWNPKQQLPNEQDLGNSAAMF